MESGEVRRLHVVYFLSRMGHVEQPHLIRVHHLPRRGGVYLRDVKRWLGELRGKAMPEAFAWSYKRQYRAGYVWQDLVDDDLITPISDNEYVLQGSQLYPTAFFDNSRLCSSSTQTKDLDAYEDSERSMVTDDGDSMKVEERAKNLEVAKQGIVERTMQKEGEPMSTVSSASSSSEQHAFTKSKSYSSGASTMLRQWITCGAIDTDDSVLIKNPSPKDSSLEKPKNGAVFCRDDEMGGSARVQRNSWDGNLELSCQHSQQNSRKSLDDSRKKRQKESGGGKVAVTHKPMAGPNCSLCGKSFKPEKMHSHMKSCKGLKSLTKTATTSTKSKSTTAKSSDKELVSTYLLTN
ncbi:protein UPSTREAM OF FLC-like [Cucurbita moschata]|uniref:Protein UPSTREAM OF FLC-like n=1 Tax=Cucurbita moschata TaxID=3662 RepID=A0A6J1H7K3_CUCMO|nr:protein UPSTREAM OF FLC-like [Cucurbita moschata]